MLLVVAQAFAAPPSESPWSDGRWSHRAELQVRADRLRGDVLDLPVLVAFAEDRPPGFAYAQAGPDGADLRFVDRAGRALDYELDSWDAEGTSSFWVRFPSLAPDEGAVPFYVYWGNPDALDRSDGGGTFGPTAAHVWHLQDCVASADCPDSVDGDALAITLGQVAPGAVGQGMKVGAGVAWWWGDQVAPFSASTWFETPGWSGENEVVAAALQAVVRRCGTSDEVGLGLYGDPECVGAPAPAGEVHQALFAAVDADTYELYVDGEPVLVPNLPLTAPSSGPLAFGNLLLNQRPFSGWIDEIRVGDRPLRADDVFAGWLSGRDELVDYDPADPGTLVDTAEAGRYLAGGVCGCQGAPGPGLAGLVAAGLIATRRRRR